MGKKVYVAGPMSIGDTVTNIRQGVLAGAELMKAGHYPFVPHLSHFAHMIHNEDVTYEMWLTYDREWVIVCDALIRLPGKSRGADQEERWARRHSIPVYYSVEEFLNAEL